jgi:hypothetical protein
MVRMNRDCRLSTGLPPSSRLRRLRSRKGDLQRAWNRDRKAVWDQVGLSHCHHEGLAMVRDEAYLRRGHDEQSCRGHQCSKTTLTGESWFHINTPWGFEPGSLVTGSKGSPLDQWDMVRMKWDCRLYIVSFFLLFILARSGCHSVTVQYCRISVLPWWCLNQIFFWLLCLVPLGVLSKDICIYSGLSLGWDQLGNLCWSILRR